MKISIESVTRGTQLTLTREDEHDGGLIRGIKSRSVGIPEINWGGATVPQIGRGRGLSDTNGEKYATFLRGWDHDMPIKWYNENNHEWAFNVAPIRAMVSKGLWQYTFDIILPEYMARNYAYALRQAYRKISKTKRRSVFKTSHITRPFQTVIGIELEGGWDAWHWERLRPYGKGDGSVRVNDLARNGEVASPIFRADRRGQWENWIRDNHPEETNTSCGLHVHFGFFGLCTMLDLRDKSVPRAPAPYAELMDKTVAQGIIDAVKKVLRNPEIERRLDGNEYCHPEIVPLRAQIGSHSNRYMAINYQALNKFNSIEFRFLPMGRESSQSVHYVNTLANAVLSVTRNARDYQITMEV